MQFMRKYFIFYLPRHCISSFATFEFDYSFGIIIIIYLNNKRSPINNYKLGDKRNLNIPNNKIMCVSFSFFLCFRYSYSKSGCKSIYESIVINVTWKYKKAYFQYKKSYAKLHVNIYCNHMHCR